MKSKPVRLPIITDRASVPTGYVPLGGYHTRKPPGKAHYCRLLLAVHRGDVPAVRLFTNGLSQKRPPIFVHEATANAVFKAIRERQPPTRPGPLFANVTEREPAAGELELDLASRIAAARTVAELGAVGDDIERHESAGTLAPVETAALMGAINGRHDELEPVATVAASLTAGDPGTVDRLAASLERVAEALEEILRRGRVELDLEPCT